MLLGFDCDNGSEFLNHHLWRYLADRPRPVICTRCRPYKKNDNAHIEQKNWTHVRKLLGYVRYDSPEALEAINRLYSNELRLLQNLFLPSVKLVRKKRIGSRVVRIYDRPQTPLQRVMACKKADAQVVAKLEKLTKHVDPFKLASSIEQQLEAIYDLASLRGRAARSTPRPKWRQLSPLRMGAWNKLPAGLHS